MPRRRCVEGLLRAPLPRGSCLCDDRVGGPGGSGKGPRGATKRPRRAGTPAARGGGDRHGSPGAAQPARGLLRARRGDPLVRGQARAPRRTAAGPGRGDPQAVRGGRARGDGHVLRPDPRDAPEPLDLRRGRQRGPGGHGRGRARGAAVSLRAAVGSDHRDEAQVGDGLRHLPEPAELLRGAASPVITATLLHGVLSPTAGTEEFDLGQRAHLQNGATGAPRLRVHRAGFVGDELEFIDPDLHLHLARVGAQTYPHGALFSQIGVQHLFRVFAYHVGPSGSGIVTFSVSGPGGLLRAI
mmetsp:Transcript_12822/g.37417  ORF Transcript_12822/g.37417 Transcript_12822/m.37417 type:complete len:298 (-) Transcript_12822:915-1808(-)